MSWTWPGDLDLPPANGHASPGWSSSTELSVTEHRNPRFLPQGHGKRKNVTANAELTMGAILFEIGTDRLQGLPCLAYCSLGSAPDAFGQPTWGRGLEIHRRRIVNRRHDADTFRLERCGSDADDHLLWTNRRFGATRTEVGNAKVLHLSALSILFGVGYSQGSDARMGIRHCTYRNFQH
jgi:hypothetical protein